MQAVAERLSALIVWHCHVSFLLSLVIRLLSRAHGDAGGALEFAPAYPCAFDGAQDRFPDAVTEHGTVNQAHRQNAPGAHDWLALEQAGERGEDDVHCQEND